MPQLFTTQFPEHTLQGLDDAISRGMFVHARKLLLSLPAPDAAHILESSIPNNRLLLWPLLDEVTQADILQYLSDDVRSNILKQMQPHQLAAATETMDTDDIADLLQDLPDKMYHQVLQAMDEDLRDQVVALVNYPEDTAGGLMNTDTITVRPEVFIEVALRYLRQIGNIPEGTDQIFVVDRQHKYLGALPLTQLLTAQPEQTIESLMRTQNEPLNASMSNTDVAHLFERNDWISAPVVDNEGILIGRITIDDVVDVIREEGEHSLMSMAGMDEEEDTFSPVFTSTKRRSIWLAVNLGTALLAAGVSNLFEETLQQLVSLAILMTIVPSMGGVAGSQTLTLVVRGLALGHIGQTNSRWLLGKELAVGLLNGLIWAVVIATIATIWKGDIAVGAIIAAAMLTTLIAAGLSGVFIPLMLKKLKIDPALAGTVILTTVTDVVGLVAFLGLASLFL